MRYRNYILIALAVVLLSGISTSQNLYTSDDGLPIFTEKNMTLSVGESWLDGWQWREPLNFYEVAGSGTDYPVKITVYSDAGDGSDGVSAVSCESNCQIDFDDIRFTEDDGITELDYWLETYTSDDTAIFWIEVTDDLSSGTVIAYIYYGNDAVSTTSDGEAIFIFFDDFENNNLDRWTSADANWGTTTTRALMGTYCAFADGGTGYYDFLIKDGLSLTYDVMFHMWMQIETESGGYAERFLDVFDEDDDTVNMAQVREDDMAHYNDSDVVYYETGGFDDDTWYRNEFGVDMSEFTSKYYRNRVAKNTVQMVDRDEHSSSSITKTRSYTENGATEDYWVDDWYIRKWNAAGEPFMSGPSAEEESNAVPEVEDGYIANPDTGDILYGYTTLYYLCVNTTDADGYADIDKVSVLFGQDGDDPRKFTVEWEDGVGYSESDVEIELDSDSCSIAESGDALNVTFAFWVTFEIWDYHQRNVYDILVFVYDKAAASDNSLYALDYAVINANVVTDLTTDDIRVDVDTVDCSTITGTFAIAGTEEYPSSSAVDIWAICPDVSTSPFEAIYDSGTGGFTVDVDSDDVVGKDTYEIVVVAEDDGASGTNLLVSDLYVYIIADSVTVTLASTYTYLPVSISTTITASGVFDYDGSAFDGNIVVNDTIGVVSESAGSYGWEISSINGGSYNITDFSSNTVTVVWDTIEIVSGPSYYWVQYSENAVYLVWGFPSTYGWTSTGEWLQQGTLLKSYINGSLNAQAAIFSETGDFNGLTIGPFNPNWYYANISIRVEDSIGDYSWDYEIWQEILEVDILHSIHIEDSVFYLTDNWVTVGIQTNWNNATFYIWDNITGTPVYQGGSYEGLYQIAKSVIVGVHSLIILVNGTQGTIDSGSQVAGTTDTDGWEYLQFTYTVNPVTFSITDPYVMQNNDTVVFGAIFYTGDLTIDYTIYEDGISITTGILTIPSSGSYYLVKWTKSDATSVANWTIVLQAGSTNITIYGYNLIIESAIYTYNSSGHFEGDNYIVGDSTEDLQLRALDSQWDAVSTIMLLISLPFVVGIALRVDRAKGKPRGKRKKEDDKFRII